MGNSRKYPYPTTDGFHVLTPPPLAFGNSKMHYPPMPSEFHNHEPPSPSEFLFFLEVHFRLNNGSMNIRTWIYASSRLWSSGARWQALLFSQWPGCANSFLSLNLAIKINTTYGNFTPLCFLVLFWRLQSKIAQIQTVKTFRLANTVKSSIFPRCFPFMCHVVCTKSVLNLYGSCSVHEAVHECLKFWQASWKWGPSASFLLFIRWEWQFASGKIHFQILFMWQEINQGTCKCLTHILLFTARSYEHKHVSDLSMFVFCFRGHTFMVCLRTTPSPQW